MNIFCKNVLCADVMGLDISESLDWVCCAMKFSAQIRGKSLFNFNFNCLEIWASLYSWPKMSQTFLLTCCFAYFLLLLSMLHISSGYMGCGMHYGRNGSPQNPFSRKGLYPCAAWSSSVLHLKKTSEFILEGLLQWIAEIMSKSNCQFYFSFDMPDTPTPSLYPPKHPVL